MKSFLKFLKEDHNRGYQPWFIHFKYGLENLTEAKNEFKHEIKMPLYVKNKNDKENDDLLWSYVGTKTLNPEKNKLEFYKSVKSKIKEYYPNTSLKDLKIKTDPTVIQKVQNTPAEKDTKKTLDISLPLQTHYKFPSAEHENYIRDYTSGSSVLNKDLYKHHQGLLHEIDPYQKEKIKYLDEVMERNIAPRDIVVHSGMKRSPEQLKEIHSSEDGRHFRIFLPAYTSTSLKLQKAKDFCTVSKTKSKYGSDLNHILTIKVPKGSHGVYVERITSYNDEHEFILPRNSKVHISSKPTVKGNKVYWYGRLVHDGWKPTKAHKSLQMNFFRKLLGQEDGER